LEALVKRPKKKKKPREQPSIVKWVVLVVLLAAVGYFYRDKLPSIMKVESSQETPRGTIDLFVKCLIERDVTLLTALCKPGHEQAGLWAMDQLKGIVDSTQMSAPDPDHLEVEVKVRGVLSPGKQVDALVKMYGVNRDYGANLEVKLEYQDTEEWKVIRAMVTPQR
jgi:hypothetical protein